uniref:ADAM metallopeptidase with thrombospondin type 1 motif 12 n=1 Tax=Equus asinus asinus TaxID=83772 RepID=A0A8C4M5G8_EQUAS
SSFLVRSSSPGAVLRPLLCYTLCQALPEYHVVAPVRVDASGHFLSYGLHHPISSSRRKRDLGGPEDQVYYRISHEEKDLFFNLTVNQGFLSKSYIVERRYGNLSHVKMVASSGPPCHLRGTVLQQGTRIGTAALSACHGLTGLFHLPHGDFFIEPIKKHPLAEGGYHPHIIYRRQRRRVPEMKEPTCGLKDSLGTSQKLELQREKWERNNLRSRGLSRRSISKERWVETLVVADTKMIEYHGSENVESYILTIMNMVTGLFHNPSIGNAIHIVVVRLILLEEEEQGLKIVHHAEKTLSSFCKWQKSINPKSDLNPAHHDVAVLLTRKDICAGVNRPCETLGLSHLSGMCQPHRSCNINEDSGLPLAFTIAHELGHSFGIQHDGKENDCEPIDRHPFIMSRQLQYNPTPLTWSKCSKEYITRFLDRGWGFCLDDIPKKKGLKSKIVAPGVIYDVHHQCQLQYGPNATFCQEVENVCQTLWCSVKGFCRSKLDAAADGTRCGEKKWCMAGKCITVGKKPESIPGGWGRWSPWSHCSRTCGAGAQSAERLCNSPEPKFGGKYCTGERKRYRLCNVHPCRPDTPTFRQLQCSEFDTVPYKNAFYHWFPVFSSAHPCELYCRPIDGQFSEKMLDAVIDGTPCFEGGNSRNVCINGICKMVGCDYEIDSNATEDRCGVCLGDGSACQTVRKMFKQKEGSGYVDIGLIPKGARDIRIMEVEGAGNFLAIRSEDPEKYYLNGGFIIQWNGNYKLAGTIFQYDRKGDLEKLIATGPTNESVWIQLLFQVTNPGIKYEYTIRKDGLDNDVEKLVYFWQYGHWTECSVTCGTGIRRQTAHCVKQGHGMVKATFCDPETQPNGRQKKCYEKDCPPRWWAGEWEACSATCGPHGEKKRTVLCIQTMGSDEQALQAKDCQHLLKPKTLISCNRDILCPSDWTVGNWSECSVSCGGGVRIRSVTCAKNHDEPCDVTRKPNSRALCGLQQCPSSRRVLKPNKGTIFNGKKLPTPEQDPLKPIPPTTSSPRMLTTPTVPQSMSPSVWASNKPLSLGGYGVCLRKWPQPPSSLSSFVLQCSTTCGLGAYWRHVECSTHLDSDCAAIQRPDPAKRCHLRPCAGWKVGNWSKCSRNCSGGFQIREIQCVDSRDHRNLRPFHCQFLAGIPPPLSMSCNTEPCEEWQVEPWSQCSRSCGGGVQERIVTCPGDFCDWTKKPTSTRPCNAHPCCHWATGHWDLCTASCGGGFQKRTVHCVSSEDNKTEDQDQCLCDHEPRPPEFQKYLLCTKDKLSTSFCQTLKTMKKCSVPTVRVQCCLSCSQTHIVPSRRGISQNQLLTEGKAGMYIYIYIFI